MGVLRRFTSDHGGTVAMTFGLALLPLAGMVGAALDYSRAGLEQTRLQRATDAIALSLSSEPATTTASGLQARADKLLSTLYGAPNSIAISSFTATRTGQSIRVAVSATNRNSLMQIVGVPSTAVGATSLSAWGQSRIELALVLDNTGSMNDLIGGQRKIDALKASALRMVSDLRAIARDPDTIKVSVVPFDTEVRLDAASYRDKDWFRWAQPTDRALWTGYVYDRYAGYATTDAAPVNGTTNSLFPAPRDTGYRSDPQLIPYRVTSDLPTMRPLTSLYDASTVADINAVIGAMQPRGNTNIALGLMWGTATLTSSEPFAEAAPVGAPLVHKYLMLLTDGNNTMSHVNGALNVDTAAIDASTATACALAKSNAVEVFTIRLLDGDTSLLRSCATDADHYFDVQNAPQLTNAFRKIVDAISGTRLTQ